MCMIRSERADESFANRNRRQWLILVHWCGVGRNQRHSRRLAFQQRQTDAFPKTRLHADVTFAVEFVVMLGKSANLDIGGGLCTDSEVNTKNCESVNCLAASMITSRPLRRTILVPSCSLRIPRSVTAASTDKQKTTADCLDVGIGNRRTSIGHRTNSNSQRNPNRFFHWLSSWNVCRVGQSIRSISVIHGEPGRIHSQVGIQTIGTRHSRATWIKFAKGGLSAKHDHVGRFDPTAQEIFG